MEISITLEDKEYSTNAEVTKEELKNLDFFIQFWIVPMLQQLKMKVEK